MGFGLRSVFVSGLGSIGSRVQGVGFRVPRFGVKGLKAEFKETKSKWRPVLQMLSPKKRTCGIPGLGFTWQAYLPQR